MPYPPMTSKGEQIEEDIPEHIRRIQAKALNQSQEKSEIDWGFWFYISKHIFHYSEQEFFGTTLRKLYILADQHQQMNKQKG